MAQVESYQVPAHPSGLEMRTQLNAIILALIGDNAGPNAPAETYPGMMWGDTTSNTLKRRTNANDGWVTIGPLDDFLGEMRTGITNAANAANNRVLRSGDTMTGPLTLAGATLMFANTSLNWMGYLGAYGAAGQAGSGIGFVNSALNLWNFQFGDDGTWNARGTGTVNGGLRVIGGRLELRQQGGAGYGEISMYGPDGTVMFMRGRSNGGGGMEWINNDYNNIPMSLDNGGTLSCQGEVWAAGGNGRLAGNGNIYGPVWGGWLSDWLNSRAVAGAQVQHGSGIQIEISAINIGGGSDYGDLPGPYVCAGLRRDTNNWLYVRGLWLRNQ